LNSSDPIFLPFIDG